MHHMAADGVGAAQQRGGILHVAGGQRLAHGELDTRRPCTS
jgi:hypothetical protein